MLTSYATPERSASPNFLEGQVAFSHPRLSNNRSVMPLDVRGCTRATLTGSACAYHTPAGAERKSEVRRRSDTVVVPTINDADWRCGGVIPMTRRAASGKPKSLGSGGIGGAICLVNSDNERDSGMLTSYATPERSASPNFLEGQVAFSHPRLSNNRSVMPLDVRGCTRATLTGSACAYPTPAGAGNPLNPIRDGHRGLQLFPMNEEFPLGIME
ncbi:TPA: hypothetical protein BOS_23211 [Bos taurus]|nr:TPA: hypothetical protein BOS_23211 [Bos taurus]